jgi:signal-transduction protein with cAMP-binding, CBS, and nucleotidyltransferase domain
VQGVVSALDISRLVRKELEPGVTSSTYFRDERPYSGPDWIRLPEDFQDRMRELTAADAMTREIVAVGPDATIDDVARTMLEHHVYRVLVCEGRLLLGVVSTFDLLRALTRVPTIAPPVGSIRHTGYSW